MDTDNNVAKVRVGRVGAGGKGAEQGKIEDICDNVNNKKKVLRLSCSRDLQDC